MNEKEENSTGGESLLELWLKTAGQFNESLFAQWQAVSSTDRMGSGSDRTASSRIQESVETMLKTWQAFGALWKEPDAMDGMVKGVAAFPEIMSKMLKPAVEGYFHLQQEWLERAGRIGKSTAAYHFENLDQEAFKAWLTIYEKEFRKFLTVPQLGLARGYQERFTQAADKFNVFQATTAEFLSLLYLPMEKSFKVMQTQLAEMADEGTLPEQSKELYRLWVKMLEGHYMALFKSPEYTETLRRILDSLGQFHAAKQEILQDALQAIPVPTHREMDDLYKEIYLLKKRVKALEKQGACEAPDGGPEN